MYGSPVSTDSMGGRASRRCRSDGCNLDDVPKITLRHSRCSFHVVADEGKVAAVGLLKGDIVRGGGAEARRRRSVLTERRIHRRQRHRWRETKAQ
jgi:hypothetical protein